MKHLNRNFHRFEHYKDAHTTTQYKYAYKKLIKFQSLTTEYQTYKLKNILKKTKKQQATKIHCVINPIFVLISTLKKYGNQQISFNTLQNH